MSCGVRVQVKDTLIPSLRTGSAAICALDLALLSDHAFRSDLSSASSKEPPANMSGVGDLAVWLMTHDSELRRAKHACAAVVGAGVASHHP